MRRTGGMELGGGRSVRCRPGASGADSLRRVQKDLDYRRVLTANYIMANPMAADAYGRKRHSTTRMIVHEFRPSEIVSYYRDDEIEEVADVAYEKFDIIEVTEPGNLATDYPHAGILNTTGVPAALPVDRNQPQPGPVAVDLLPLPRLRHREVEVADHGSGCP